MNKPVRSYRDLLVWQRGMAMAADVYQLTSNWTREEVYGLTSQARRAAASIPANVAEGYGRQSTASYGYFLKIARGSLMELETHLLLAERIGCSKAGAADTILQQSDELSRMLAGLIKSLGNPSERKLAR